MIGVDKRKIAGVPCLVVEETTLATLALPTVIYFHGITSAKEHNLPLAYLLAEKGVRVVLPDSKYHGERETKTMTNVSVYLFEIVLENIDELNAIKVQLENEGLIKDDKIGVAGTSMGGITTASAMTQYPWIKSAAILMGSPKLTRFAKEMVDIYSQTEDVPFSDMEIKQLIDTLTLYDLSLQAEKLHERPLLFWHGDSDPTVPYNHSFTFYQQLQKIYTEQTNIKFIGEKNRGHKVSRNAILQTVNWFVKHLQIKTF